MTNLSWQRTAFLLRNRIFEEQCGHNGTAPRECADCADLVAVRIYEAKLGGDNTLSWSKVADRLSARLTEAHCEDHDEIEVDCPFCDDVAAYENYRRKVESVGSRLVRHDADTVAVRIEDLPINKRLMIGGMTID